ncbi:MAG: hypothetical protein K0Q59_641 [Paenibacillus sp.]|jgi:hypothetical protein|nr:hypothetical protein [Paenibacillus sp.]
MERSTDPNRLHRLLGSVFCTQALTSLVGGAVFFKPYVSEGHIDVTMRQFADNVSSIYCGVFLQIITAIVIVMLGVAMVQAAGHIHRTMAMIALSLYIVEAVLLALSQIFVFGFTDVSQLYAANEDPVFLQLGQILLSLRDFTALVAIIPFGIGAILFYTLLMKARILPKWLARWGLVTVPFVLVGATFMAFDIAFPLVLVIPYMPFEFVAGVYIWVRSSRQ